MEHEDSFLSPPKIAPNLLKASNALPVGGKTPALACVSVASDVFEPAKAATGDWIGGPKSWSNQ